jgi:hypothetical protein
MAFTRFHDDPCRITKQLQQMTDQGRWVIDVPGNGVKPCFVLDPQIIPQKWGANLMTHSVDVQSCLLGIDKELNRDCLKQDNYKRLKVHSSPISYPYCDTFLTTEQSRVIRPAWTARDLPQDHKYILLEDPQKHTEVPFDNFVSSRILEKDNFTREYDCVPENNQNYSLPVKSLRQQGNTKLCSSSNSCFRYN